MAPRRWCAIPLSTDGSLCRVPPARCDTITTDSGRLSVDILDGDGFLDGARLTLTIEASADFIDAGFSCDVVST
ncbi:MAG: hypothetical protein JRH11_13575 [Deltaproteobacteria bacterium]|nr:hypothetical protein [Deltaproteobacteria bacterium]